MPIDRRGQNTMAEEDRQEYRRLLAEIDAVYERGELTRERWEWFMDAAAKVMGDDPDLEPFYCYAQTEWLDLEIDGYGDSR
jgi:hypothetical protein